MDRDQGVLMTSQEVTEAHHLYIQSLEEHFAEERGFLKDFFESLPGFIGRLNDLESRLDALIKDNNLVG